MERSVERPHSEPRAIEHIDTARVACVAEKGQFENLFAPQGADQNFAAHSTCQGPRSFSQRTGAETLRPSSLPPHRPHGRMGVEHVFKKRPLQEAPLLKGVQEARRQRVGPLVGPNLKRPCAFFAGNSQLIHKQLCL